ncbi:MAG: SAM-dependent methyltransferase, partial [Candidatus Poribacteria bacterium]|nr:SAM-dependent methyltransferase [Candidatus Poribacteria bacterium]
GLAEDLPTNFRQGKILFQDATNWWPREVEQLDAVITSPPFFDSTRFYSANWLRLWFSGWSADNFKTGPSVFVDEKQKSSFDVYIPILRQAKERLKSNGVVVLHLGKSAKCNMAAHLRELGKRWFRSIDLFDESVAHCESHGIRDKGTVTSHQYLVLY